MWAAQHCRGSLSSVSPTSATEKPIFSNSYMNWPSIPVQAMHAQHWPTHYTPQSLTLSLTLIFPLPQALSLLFIISPTHHYPHCALPTVIHPSFVLPARSVILSILPFRPPGFSFLVWPGITPQRAVNGTTVSASLCVLFQSLVCVLRGRGGGGGRRGSGLRMWARCPRTLIPPPSLGPSSASAHKGWLIERDSEGSVETYTPTTMAL